MGIEDRRLTVMRDTVRLAEQAGESARLCGDLEIMADEERPIVELAERLEELETAPITPRVGSHLACDTTVPLEHNDGAQQPDPVSRRRHAARIRPNDGGGTG